MKNEFTEKLVFGLGPVWIGLHMIYFVCIEQGTNNSSNPAWVILSGLVFVEKCIFCIGILVGMYLVVNQWLAIPPQKPIPMEAKHEPVVIEELPKIIKPPIPEPVPKPKPIEPTSSELKSRAIAAIVRKNK